MIAYIKGVIESVAEGAAVIEQGGVGYHVSVSASTLGKLTMGQETKLLTHLQVREDAFTLFGFISKDEREMFLRLTAVSGVGPKSAMSLLSLMSPPQVILAVITSDAAALSRAQGIGKKTAERIVLELKDKLRSVSETEDMGVGPQIGIHTSTGPKQDAAEALTSLGYGRSDAVRAVMEVYTDGLDTEQTIKLALKKLVK